jgi:hypothetical protein
MESGERGLHFSDLPVVEGCETLGFWVHDLSCSSWNLDWMVCCILHAVRCDVENNIKRMTSERVKKMHESIFSCLPLLFLVGILVSRQESDVRYGIIDMAQLS